MSTRVEIVIDELVLHGFSQADRHAIGEALSLELQQLIAAGNPTQLAGLKSAPTIRAGNIHLKSGAKPSAVGEHIAGAVHASLQQRGAR